MAHQAMGLDDGSSVFQWMHIIGKNLNITTRQHWNLFSKGDDVQSTEESKKFLEQQARALEASIRATKVSSKSKQMIPSKKVQDYQSN